jgi:hypothetical protein
MLNLETGDQIELFYEDAPDTMIRATVRNISSDRDEGMGIAVEDYASYWIEIDVDGQSGTDTKQVVLLNTDSRYRLNGRPVNLRKKQD